jgi:hypothetical protein
MQAQTRLLVRHFVRGYASTDLAGGERQAALSAALLFSPSLFIIVILSSKYVMTPFPVPGLSALAGFADRLLIFGGSMVIMALVAIVQWDRLSVDARDAAILGVLPLRHGQIVQAKWIATALFAGAAALLLNGIPSLIYPIVSVGRLEASWLLILQLTTLQLAIGVLSGLVGFLVVLAVREGLLALLGARTFARISAAAQASLVVVGLLAFFLQPTFALRALRDGHPSARWWPAVVLAGTFEELGGHRVADLPAAPLPRRVRARAAAILDQYRLALGHAKGSAHRTAVAVPGLCLFLASVLFWNNRRRLEAPVLAARGTKVTRAFAWHLWRSVAPRPETRAGATFAWRTLLRSQRHRLLLAVGLAAGLAAGAVGFVQEPRRGASLADADLVVLSIQALVITSVAAGTRAALRREADSNATWLFAVAWNGLRAPYESGVALATWFILGLPVLLLAPLWWSLLGADAAITHAGVGLALALGLAELIVLTLGTLALVDDAIPSESARALPVLGVPAVVLGSTMLASAERWSALTTIGVLLALTATLRVARLWRRTDGQPVMPAAGEPSVALSLNE